jgi:hypothetical protein
MSDPSEVGHLIYQNEASQAQEWDELCHILARERRQWDHKKAVKDLRAIHNPHPLIARAKHNLLHTPLILAARISTDGLEIKENNGATSLSVVLRILCYTRLFVCARH